MLEKYDKLCNNIKKKQKQNSRLYMCNKCENQVLTIISDDDLIDGSA